MTEKYLLLKTQNRVSLEKTTNTFAMLVTKYDENGNAKQEAIEIFPDKLNEEKTNLQARLTSITELLTDLENL